MYDNSETTHWFGDKMDTEINWAKSDALNEHQQYLYCVHYGMFSVFKSCQHICAGSDERNTYTHEH